MSYHQAYIRRKRIGEQSTSQLKLHNEDLIIFYIISRYYKYWDQTNDNDTPANSIILHSFSILSDDRSKASSKM